MKKFNEWIHHRESIHVRGIMVAKNLLRTWLVKEYVQKPEGRQWIRDAVAFRQNMKGREEMDEKVEESVEGKLHTMPWACRDPSLGEGLIMGQMAENKEGGSTEEIFGVSHSGAEVPPDSRCFPLPPLPDTQDSNDESINWGDPETDDEPTDGEPIDNEPIDDWNYGQGKSIYEVWKR